jgi:hypothetical protein
MLKRYKSYAISFIALLIVLASMLGANFVFAKGQHSSAANTDITSSAKPATARMMSMHTVNMRNVPKAIAKSSHGHPRIIPLRTGVSPAIYAQHKAAAAHNRNAPVATQLDSATPGARVNTPTVIKSFQGMADSASICPPSGCEPPDQALAASTSWVLQGVNTSFAVYNTSGTLQSGWPKTAQQFFGVPNPGSCDPNGPFLSDPRAFYDINDGRFWAAILQVEGAFGIACPFQTTYWIAVSQTSDPRGTWNIYSFDMSNGTINAADYTQFGFDSQAIYFSGNMFDQSGSFFQYAEVFAANKATMETGSAVTAHGFFSLTVCSAVCVLVDTVQPVEAEAHSYSGPTAGLFVNSFNMSGDPFGNNCSAGVGCHGLAVWAIANPASTTPSISGVVVSTSTNYVLAPSADEPGCPQCVDTLDTRISATPPYHNGLISFALETGTNNGTQVVPGIFWGQISPVLSAIGAITGATVFQKTIYSSTGDTANSFGALMADDDGNLFMVFDRMSSTTNPGIRYASRRATDALNRFGLSIVLKSGLSATLDSRWGDYGASSYDGFSGDHVWFSAEYSPSNHDWSTFIGEDRYTLTAP